MKHLSLFSGIGGLDLAAEWAGFTTVGFVERDKYCQRVLAKHWPGVPIWDDVREYRATAGCCDIISGGFPCQDISSAGKKIGIDGDKSGLWSEYARIIGEARPRWVVVENVSALLARGMGRVLGDLANLGFDARWCLLSAAAVGAPHRRERIFVVAHANQNSEPISAIDDEASWMPPDVADAKCWWQSLGRDLAGIGRITESATEWNPWPIEDSARAVGMDDGIPSRMDRLRSLGNAVVPQQAYPIFKAIADIEGLSCS